ncbi:MAG: Gfo/Idh/MocA family oxidoreductase, partial [Halobacteriales archaeon]|nr:Gfo/Idh/MocA family oxidoreductase [Halobacteriales archaeon]
MTGGVDRADMEIAQTLSGLGERDWVRETPDGSVRMAVIGLGGFANQHALPGIADGDFVETTVLVSGSAEKAERWAREWDAERGITYEEFHDGAAVADYDAVYIVTPNALHLDFVTSAAEYGKHVICEKPLEATYERAESLVAACDAADVKLMTAYRLQTDPAIRRVRDLVTAGILGDLVSFHGEFSVRSLRGDRTEDHWRYDADLAGGGAMLDIGVYPLNTGRFVLGCDPVSVTGTTASPDPV